MATLCPQCGHRNRDGALICSRCSARLGAEPTASTTFGAIGAGRSVPVSPLDDLRVDADAAPLHRAPLDAPGRRDRQERQERGRSSDARTGWIVAALSFFGVLAAGGAYWWSTEQGPTEMPVRDAAAAPPAAPAPNAGPPPAAVPAPAPVAQTPAPPPALQALSLEPSPNPAPAPKPASAPPPPPARRTAMAAPAAPRADAPAPRRMAAAEAPRRAPARDGMTTQSRPSAAAGESDGTAWPPLGREAANTSAPNYSDAGPPVVAGPGPRYQTAPGPGPAPAPSPTWAPAPRPAADPDAIPMPAVTGGDPGRRR